MKLHLAILGGLSALLLACASGESVEDDVGSSSSA